MEFMLRNGVNQKEYYSYILWQLHNYNSRTCHFCKKADKIKKRTICPDCWNKIVKESYIIYPFRNNHNLFSKSIFKNIFKRTYDGYFKNKLPNNYGKDINIKIDSITIDKSLMILERELNKLTGINGLEIALSNKNIYKKIYNFIIQIYIWHILFLNEKDYYFQINIVSRILYCIVQHSHSYGERYLFWNKKRTIKEITKIYPIVAKVLQVNNKVIADCFKLKIEHDNGIE